MPPKFCLDKSRRQLEGGRPRKIIPGAMAGLAAVYLFGWLTLFLCSPALADLAAPSNLRIEQAGDGGPWAGGDVTLAWDFNSEPDLE
jgi:hypothetical protein